MSVETDIFVPGEKGYVVLDIESQGYVRFCPIEIAMARFSPGGALLDSYSTLVRPRVSRVSRVVTELTGITSRMLLGAPAPQEVMAGVRAFLGSSVIVGHDVAANDIPIIDHFCERLYHARLDNLCVDTLYWAQTLFPGLGHYNLKYLAEHFGVKSDTYHRALDDCLTTSRLYQRLLESALLLDADGREKLLFAFAHRRDAAEKKNGPEAGSAAGRALDYTSLPVYDARKTGLPARLAALHVRALSDAGAEGITLGLSGEARQTERFIAAHAECGWAKLGRNVFCAERLALPALDKLGRVLRGDGFVLFRAESAAAARIPDAPPGLRFDRLPPFEGRPGAGYAVLRAEAVSREGAARCELTLGAPNHDISGFVESHPECGFSISPSGAYAADLISPEALRALKDTLEEQGVRLCRPAGGRARPRGGRIRPTAPAPVEIAPEGDGYDVVFVDATRGVPDDWLIAQPGVRRENFFRFHAGAGAAPPEQMREKLARLGWRAVLRAARRGDA